jgi:2,3-bisphosphoglycerate-dependent phosphoglycerate mutase
MAAIFLFRHGETTYNKKKIFTGWQDAELTEGGIEECKGIAKALEHEKPTKAYTSDLKRAQHTLMIALGDRKDVKITIDARLKERNYGDLNGQSKVELEKKYPKEYPLWHRSYDVIPTLKKDDVVFISAHGNSLRPIRRYFEHMSTEEMCSFEHIPGKIYKYVI